MRERSARRAAGGDACADVAIVLDGHVEVTGEGVRRPRLRRRASSKVAPVSCCIDVTRDAGEAARDDVLEVREVGVDVEREAVGGDAARDAHADGGDLRVADPDAGLRSERPAAMPKRASTSISTASSERTYHDGPSPYAADVDDRVADELAGAVERHVAAAVGAVDFSAARQERLLAEQQVLRLAAHAERVRRRVFEEDERGIAAVAHASRRCAAGAARRPGRRRVRAGAGCSGIANAGLSSVER